MKIQIDTTNKTIKIEQDVDMGELVTSIKKLLPSDWKEYKILMTNILDWGYPIIIKDNYPWKPQPFWEYNPTITTGSSSVYNVEVQ